MSLTVDLTSVVITSAESDCKLKFTTKLFSGHLSAVLQIYFAKNDKTEFLLKEIGDLHVHT